MVYVRVRTNDASGIFLPGDCVKWRAIGVYTPVKAIRLRLRTCRAQMFIYLQFAFTIDAMAVKVGIRQGNVVAFHDVLSTSSYVCMASW